MKLMTRCTFNEQELRIEDYEAGRKTGATGSTGFTGLSTSTSTGGLFGNPSATGFGASSSLIGQKQTTGFGASGMNRSNPASFSPIIFGTELARYYRLISVISCLSFLNYEKNTCEFAAAYKCQQ